MTWMKENLQFHNTHVMRFTKGQFFFLECCPNTGIYLMSCKKKDAFYFRKKTISFRLCWSLYIITTKPIQSTLAIFFFCCTKRKICFGGSFAGRFITLLIRINLHLFIIFSFCYLEQHPQKCVFCLCKSQEILWILGERTGCVILSMDVRLPTEVV